MLPSYPCSYKTNYYFFFSLFLSYFSMGWDEVLRFHVLCSSCLTSACSEDGPHMAQSLNKKQETMEVVSPSLLLMGLIGLNGKEAQKEQIIPCNQCYSTFPHAGCLKMAICMGDAHTMQWMLSPCSKGTFISQSGFISKCNSVMKVRVVGLFKAVQYYLHWAFFFPLK